MKRIVSVILFILVLMASLSFADVNEHSIARDNLGRVFGIKLTEGNSVFTTNTNEAKEREQLNNDILYGKNNQNISLYDRFGPDISFMGYYGEKNYSIELKDKIYSHLKENKLDEFVLKDLFYKSNKYFNTEIYEGRAPVLSGGEVQAGANDPRVKANSVPNIVGGVESLSNFIFWFSKRGVEISSWIITGQAQKMFFDVTDYIYKSKEIRVLFNVILTILPVFILFILVKLAKEAKKTLRGDGSSGTNSLVRQSIAIIMAIGIIFMFSFNPSITNNIVRNTTGFIDNIFNATISEVTKDDEITGSDKGTAVQAMLWKTAIFDPWTRGMFGDKYENLYTQYSDKEHKMNQSFNNTEDLKDGEKVNSSATMTGDVFVPKNNLEDKVQNWAAFAWSTQSKYHISHDEKLVDKDKVWPKSITTETNENIYIDAFRWIDAKLNISPQYTNKGPIMTYINTNEYSQDFLRTII